MYPSTVKGLHKAFFLSTIILLSVESLFAQLVFKNPERIAGNNLEAGAVYRFPKVTANIDALVRIDSLINGASVVEIDQSSGFGYDDAFQPKIMSGGNGKSYAVFTISFVWTNTSLTAMLASLTATNLDLDGNMNLKEFCEFDMSGGIASFMSNTPEINVTGAAGKYYAENVGGIEYSGIDTSADAVMFKVHKNVLSQFNVRLGAKVSNNSQAARQYSVYMKDFQITNAVTLPVSLLQFQATLNDKSTSLTWTTNNHFNFSHFVVEKSTDARNFSEAVMVMGAESTTAQSSYTYKDDLKNSTSKTVYYRLKMVDVDEKYTYSEVRMVRLVTENKIQISTFPNPVVNELRVMVPANWQEKTVTYEIYNSNGVMMSRVQNARAAQVQQLNVQSLNSGNYVVRVSNGSTVSTSKFVKLN